VAVKAPVRLVVDWQRCAGHGDCAELLPELVARDDWGYPVIAPQAIPTGLHRLAVRARSACPTLALSLQPAPAGDADPGH